MFRFFTQDYKEELVANKAELACLDQILGRAECISGYHLDMRMKLASKIARLEYKISNEVEDE